MTDRAHEVSPQPDVWRVYSHSLDAKNRILEQCRTQLHLIPGAGGFLATFNAQPGAGNGLPIHLHLHRNLLDSHSYAGRDVIDDTEYYSRLIVVSDAASGIQVLLGHISDRSRESKNKFRRDFFCATREERTVPPTIQKRCPFDQTVMLPLSDHRPSQAGGPIELSPSHLVIERHSYEIDMQELACGAKEFTTRLPGSSSRAGGLVLPMAPHLQRQQHLLLVCYHHLHLESRHAALGHPALGVGVPGHPACTNAFAGYLTV